MPKNDWTNPQPNAKTMLAARSRIKTFGVTIKTWEVNLLVHFLQRLPTAHCTMHLGQTWVLQSTHLSPDSWQECVPFNLSKAVLSVIVNPRLFAYDSLYPQVKD